MQEFRNKITILIIIIMFILSMGFILIGCQTEAQKVSYNLSHEADNFNVVRNLTVIDCITGDILFQMSGRISIYADTADNQLEITVEYKKGAYQKHFIGLSDNVTYVVEDKEVTNVDEYKYELNFNPKMWLPYKVDIKD